ncbi:hypothetical protein GCM10009552_15570 [Rothia nasimurium]|uniref:Uncharacterized protein n=1 Tax=Luteibacter anthropi TaxID=564369 RepID=A0A7X5ZIX5_9GAMM|nr:hypothetical protein [Luteibacter anthropi]NII07221.1 hypothetical protein [Luteibacter anthropi]
MSTETKVDVLAGLKLAAADRHAEGNTAAANELLEIVSAVAELIEAANKVWRRGGDVPGSEWDDLGNVLARVGGAEKNVDVLATALVQILGARDYSAEHGKYPVGTVGHDQAFDDWAAEVAGAALARAGGAS